MDHVQQERYRTIWKAVYWLNWFLILFFWLKGSYSLFGEGAGAIMIALGRIAGLSAAYMVLLQFFFMGRLPWLERIFGLDTLSRIHHTNGTRGLVFLIVHPLLIVVGSSLLTGVSLVPQFLNLLTSHVYFIYALVGLSLFIVVGGTSLVVVFRKFRYESWYFVHLLAYFAVFFSFWHQIEFGHTLTSNNFFYGYWIALYIMVALNQIIFRLARPIYTSLKHQFAVSRVVRETPSTVSVYIRGNKLDEFDIHSGQFMIVRFRTKGMWWQAHPFSLSKMADHKELRITVRELGDFTKQIAGVPVGTKVMVSGPYGVFTDLFSVTNKSLLIAGGIGITPLRSLAEEMVRKGKDVVLLYGNRNAEDIPLKSELDSLEREFPLKVIHVLSDEVPTAERVERGRIDEEKIVRLVPDYRERDNFVCGPPPMMDGVIAALRKLGVPEPQIRFEKFSLG